MYAKAEHIGYRFEPISDTVLNRLSFQNMYRIGKYDKVQKICIGSNRFESYRLNRTLDLGLWTLNLGPWTLDLGPWTLDVGPWTTDLGPWTLDIGPWTLDLGPRTLDLGPWTSDLGPWPLDLET